MPRSQAAAVELSQTIAAVTDLEASLGHVPSALEYARAGHSVRAARDLTKRYQWDDVIAYLSLASARDRPLPAVVLSPRDAEIAALYRSGVLEGEIGARYSIPHQRVVPLLRNQLGPLRWERLRAAHEAARERIRARVIAEVRAFERDGEVRVPGLARCIVGTKPAA